MKWTFFFLFAAVLFSSGLLAQDTLASGDCSVPDIKLSGYGYYMFGQLVKGVTADEWESPATSINHLWSNTCLVHLHAASNVTDWLTTNLGFELYVGFYYKSGGAMNKANYLRNYKTYMVSAEGIMHWNFEHSIMSSLKIESGLFPYTNNPQVKTLGNYLFRSTVHPPSVQNKVDYPWADLLGGVAEVGLLEDKVKIEAILASEFNYVPFFDFTPAFGLYYKPNDVIDVGGAIAFHHALQANCALMPDTLGAHWQGTKLDFRVIFDPKPLFGSMDFFGKDQFKIYAEVGVLGLKNTLDVDTSNFGPLRTIDWDTAEFKDLTFPEPSILQRMPFMLGISLPTWKILDLLAIELEWFNSPYMNDWFGLFDLQKAEARSPSSLKHWDNVINKDNFKWSIYLRKSVDKFELRGIFGSDHTIYNVFNPSTGNFEQTMKRPGDWHWFVELRYNL